MFVFFFQAEDGIRDRSPSRGLGDVYKRQIMNYGHSFGHAIESATDFAVPHGIAVTMGMDMANFVAARLGVGAEKHFERMHRPLARNYAGFEGVEIADQRVFE